MVLRLTQTIVFVELRLLTRTASTARLANTAMKMCKWCLTWLQPRLYQLSAPTRIVLLDITALRKAGQGVILLDGHTEGGRMAIARLLVQAPLCHKITKTFTRHAVNGIRILGVYLKMQR